MSLRPAAIALSLLLLACGERSTEPFAYRGMNPGMDASNLRLAASGVGIGAMSCEPVSVEGLAADAFCFTPDSSAIAVSVSALVQSADGMVSYLAIQELMGGPARVYGGLKREWGAPDTAIGSARRWTRGRWMASADTAGNILTVWLADTMTARLVALETVRRQLAATGADTLPYAADAVGVLEALRADSAGRGAPALASELSERPRVIHCDQVAPPGAVAGRNGSVLVAYIVDTLGRVERNSIRVLEATHRGFAPAATASIASCTLTPGRRAGQAVRTLVQQRVSFTPAR